MRRAILVQLFYDNDGIRSHGLLAGIAFSACLSLAVLVDTTVS